MTWHDIGPQLQPGCCRMAESLQLICRSDSIASQIRAVTQCSLWGRLLSFPNAMCCALCVVKIGFMGQKKATNLVVFWVYSLSSHSPPSFSFLLLLLFLLLFTPIPSPSFLSPFSFPPSLFPLPPPPLPPPFLPSCPPPPPPLPPPMSIQIQALLLPLQCKIQTTGIRIMSGNSHTRRAAYRRL